MTLAPVAVNNVLRGARWIALISGVSYGFSNYSSQLELAKLHYKEVQAKRAEQAAAKEAKRAAEASEPSILQ